MQQPTQLHERASAQRRARIQAWLELRKLRGKPRSRDMALGNGEPLGSTMTERFLAATSIAITLAVFGWPIYGWLSS